MGEGGYAVNEGLAQLIFDMKAMHHSLLSEVRELTQKMVLQHEKWLQRDEPRITWRSILMAGSPQSFTPEFPVGRIDVFNRLSTAISVSQVGDLQGIVIGAGQTGSWVGTGTRDILIDGNGTGLVNLRILNPEASHLNVGIDSKYPGGSLVPETLSPSPTLLAASAVYTADKFLVGPFDKIVGSVFADQTGTLDVNQSYDGTHWDVQSSITVNASTPTGFNIAVVAPYAQLVYTNGTTAQAVFRLNVGGKIL